LTFLEIGSTIKTRLQAVKRCATEGSSIMWVNRSARYPYVDRQTWYTRYHLLGRKIQRQGSVPTANDKRVAAILAQTATRLPADARLEEAVKSMEWING
jgi:hypothetical protein